MYSPKGRLGVSLLSKTITNLVSFLAMRGKSSTKGIYGTVLSEFLCKLVENLEYKLYYTTIFVRFCKFK